ncbi:MAG: DoxX family protein [Deltaproteobacteria bacterium]|nr:DoxX family protein [Deltaproteobacteria bacterium]
MTRTILRWLLGLSTAAQGVNHFVMQDLFVKMMPDYLPAHVFLVQLSGVLEVLIGLGMLVPRTRRLSGLAYLALLVAVFPANLQMALHPEDWADMPEAGLWIRLPFQLVFAAWAWWTCVAPGASSDGERTAS